MSRSLKIQNYRISSTPKDIWYSTPIFYTFSIYVCYFLQLMLNCYAQMWSVDNRLAKGIFCAFLSLLLLLLSLLHV